MVKVLLENNPAMADMANSEGAIGRLVDEVFMVIFRKSSDSINYRRRMMMETVS
jgi:hypothetical protein